MRILLVNKFYWRKAGAEVYLLDLEVRLKVAGHEVAVFATDHPDTEPTPWRKYFPKYRDFSRRQGLADDAAKLATMVWSREAKKKIAWLLRDFRPDIVHLQNVYHHLSPSVIAACRDAGVPVVQTLHDYKFICPNYTLFTDGAACERCHVYRYWNAVAYKCLKGSRSSSAAAALEMWVHRALRIYEDGVSRFITPSAAMRDIFVRWGKDPEKIVHLPNLVDLSRLPPRSPDSGSGFLFVGRLEEWKGAHLVVDAAAAAPDLNFEVLGSGPLETVLRERAATLGLSNLKFRGFLPREEVYAAMRRCRTVLVPSIGHDPFPTVALEAGALGKPVIASAIGGIPEIVKDGETGLLVPAGDLTKFLDAARSLDYDPSLALRLGAAAEIAVKTLVDPARHIERLLEIYGRAKSQSRVASGQ